MGVLTVPVRDVDLIHAHNVAVIGNAGTAAEYAFVEAAVAVELRLLVA